MMILAALLMAGCGNDVEVPGEAPATTGRTVTIRATIADGAASRVALGESSNSQTPIHWEVGDKITLFNQSDNNFIPVTFTATTVEADGTTATFTSTDAPATLPDGYYFAGYSPAQATSEVLGAMGGTVQKGKRESVGDYIVMTASCEVKDNKSYDGLNLEFAPQTPIVHAKLTCDAFKNNDVTAVRFATRLDPLFAISTFTKNNDGTIEVYFVIPASFVGMDEADGGLDCSIQAKCGNDYYEASLGKKVFGGNKLYHVEKTMTEVTLAQSILNLQIAFAGDGETITLSDGLTVSKVMDEENKVAITVPYGKNITIDGGTDGDTKTISVAENASEDLSALFCVYGTLTLKNVTLEGNIEIGTGGNVTLGEGATVEGIVTVNGKFTLGQNSSVTNSEDEHAIVIQNGGTVTFSGGTVAGTGNNKLISIDMRYAEVENYIPLVCNAKPTANNSSLQLDVATTDANSSKTIATVSYTDAAVSDFGLYDWWSGVSNDMHVTGGTLSLDNGTLTLVPPTE